MKQLIVLEMFETSLNKVLMVSPQFAIKNRFRHRSKAYPKREHWLDWASEKYSVSTVWALLCLGIPWPSAPMLSALIRCFECWVNSFGPHSHVEVDGLVSHSPPTMSRAPWSPVHLALLSMAAQILASSLYFTFAHVYFARVKCIPQFPILWIPPTQCC